MANGILSAKLQEMDGQFSLLHDRIQMCDSLNVDCIHELLQTIIAECDEKDTSLRQNLEHSQVEETAVLLEQYNAIETVICQAKKLWRYSRKFPKTERKRRKNSRFWQSMS